MFNGMNGLEILKIWPRFEDGEPVRIGDHWHEDGYDWSITSVDSIEFAEDGVRFENEYADAFYRYGERIKRPAPEVLDADNVEIHEGDTVWSTAGEFDGKRTVKSVHIDPDEPPYAMFEERQEPYSCLCCCLTHRAPILDADGVEIHVGDVLYGNETGYAVTVVAFSDGHVVAHDADGALCSVQPEYYTHRAPVLAADGVPLEIGQTVYHIADGKEYTVEELFEDGAMVTHDGITGGRCRAEYLTHERPDSWERLEEDATLGVNSYRERYGIKKHDGMTWPQLVREDLVRRCKALAERGE